MKRTPPRAQSTKTRNPKNRSPQRRTQPAPPPSKQTQLIVLLASATGATLAQMMALTGWQPHTVRGMLSGSLRQRLGLDVQSRIEDGTRVYRIAPGAGQ